jgi:hypothetical protein
MSEDKRKGDKPVPDDVTAYLNDAQLAVLHKIEGFGWGIKYIRRPLFLEPVVVVTNPDGSSIGILEDDGRLNMEPEIETRE